MSTINKVSLSRFYYYKWYCIHYSITKHDICTYIKHGMYLIGTTYYKTLNMACSYVPINSVSYSSLCSNPHVLPLVSCTPVCAICLSLSLSLGALQHVGPPLTLAWLIKWACYTSCWEASKFKGASWISLPKRKSRSYIFMYKKSSHVCEDVLQAREERKNWRNIK